MNIAHLPDVKAPASPISNEPLDLLSKLQTIVFWAGEGKKLSASDLRVLIFLVQRQNIKTGRCDPSIACLMRDTGLSERSVRASSTKLERLGAVKRKRKGKWERNSYIILPIDKREMLARLKHQGQPTRNESATQNSAALSAEECTQELQAFAPKKKKKNIKKTKSGNEESSASPSPKGSAQNMSTNLSVGRAEFERRAATAFQQKGLGYSSLLEIPCNVFESIYRSYANEKIVFDAAIVQLLGAYEESCLDL